MKRLLFLFSIICPSLLFAQQSVKLTGNVIGSTYSVDYSDNSISTTINTKDNVFDGNFNTIFASYDRSFTYVGLEFETPKVITKVGYSPRIGFGGRMKLAVIEGANTADFLDAIPLYIIKEDGVDNVMSYRDISCSRAFKYVRYVSPHDVRCNLSELEFYGYDSVGDDSRLYQLTQIPTVTIHTENAADIVDKNVYLKGKVSIISENGTNIYTGDLEIRGRGNASWTFPKKPYRMKLAKKAKLLDAPAKAKNWTLINNYGDKTLMRNLLAFDLSRRFEMKYTPYASPVDVILNGEYRGCYQLCDQIEVNENRIDIEEMENTDITEPNINGGYLIEIDAYADQEISMFYSSNKHIPVTIKYPKDDEIVQEQSAYIKKFFDDVERRLFAGYYRNEIRGYRAKFDVPSFIKHFLIGEMAGNPDTYWSTYMYKYRDIDKLFTGPVWDFDLAYNNDSRAYSLIDHDDYIHRVKGDVANGMGSFADRILEDPDSKEEMKYIWNWARQKKGVDESTLWDLVDSYAQKLEESQKLNFTRWDILNSYVHLNPRIYGSYQGEVNAVKDYIKDRLKWMDDKIGYMDVSGTKNNIADDITIYGVTGAIVVNSTVADFALEICNVFGSCVARVQNQSYLTISSGIYIAHVTTGKGTLISKKIIVK